MSEDATDVKPVMWDYHQEVAGGLQPSFDLPLVVDDWGIRVKRTSHHDYYLQKMLFVNWRLIEVPLGPMGKLSCDRSWCYSGQSANQALIAAVVNTIAWDGADGTEPGGWIKSVHDGRRGPGKYGWDTGVDAPRLSPRSAPHAATTSTCTPARGGDGSNSDLPFRSGFGSW